MFLTSPYIEQAITLGIRAQGLRIGTEIIANRGYFSSSQPSAPEAAVRKMGYQTEGGDTRPARFSGRVLADSMSMVLWPEDNVYETDSA